jgi:hypothetical protein
MSMAGGGSSDAVGIVDVDGYSYYVVDRDPSKGDRRCDGKYMSDFFMVVDSPASTINNVRKSLRVQKKGDLIQTLCRANEDVEMCEAVVEGSSIFETVRDNGKKRYSAKGKSDKAMVIEEVNGMKCTSSNSKDEVEEKVVKPTKVQKRRNRKSVVADNGPYEFGLRMPEDGIRCAGRKGTTRLLWLYEFFVVNEGTMKQPHGSIYLALQFLLGSHLPVGAVPNMTEDMSRDIWVLGISHVPADNVRHCGTSNARYLFHSEVNDGDAKTALFGRCPELVRVENCLKWHNIHSISTEVPRVVHPDDVQTRRVHVAGRKHHYVCGVTAVEDFVLSKRMRDDQFEEFGPLRHFTLSMLPSHAFGTYPDNRLGMELNSATMMWEHIEDIFRRMRGCMSSGRQGTSSATFSMPLLSSVYDFWRVSNAFHCNNTTDVHEFHVFLHLRS